MSATRDAALYFWYDVDHILLYLGITDDLAARQTAHAKRSAWSVFADHAKVQHFATREEAAAAERRAIRTQRPMFNRDYNESPGAPERLVDYLRQKGRLDLLQSYRYTPTVVAQGFGLADPVEYQDLVQIGDRLVVANTLPGRYLCTARNSKGSRCKLALQFMFGSSRVPVSVPCCGEVSALAVSATDVDRWVAQRCGHHWPTGRAVADPEWVEFDPIKHEHLATSRR